MGAKMALIWSKKSSGLPITVRTAHSTRPAAPPATVTSVVLDIDIYKNQPKFLRKQTDPNRTGWRGAEISVTIAGNWSTYRGRVLQYFQQLAVITPYATLSLAFRCPRDPKKDFKYDFVRRSDQMPAEARTVLPHPKVPTSPLPEPS